MVMTLLPGAENLGLGVNVFGDFSTQSLKPMYRMIPIEASEHTVTIGGHVYNVPKHFDATPNQTADASYVYFSGRRQVREYFSEEAQVGVKYGLFSGDFDESFGMITEADNSYSYGLTDYKRTLCSVFFSDQGSREYLTEGFKRDLATLTVPFGDDPAPYYEFLAAWGTHYTKQILLGGRLRYYIAVRASYSSNQMDVSARMQAEYEGVYASASANWGLADQSWFDNRSVKIRVFGGDTSLVSVADPSYEENRSSEFQAWDDSIAVEPNVMSYQVAPIYELLDLDSYKLQRDGLKAAIDSMFENYFETTSTSDAYTVLNFRGAPQIGTALPDKLFNVHAVVVQTPSMEIALSKSYCIDVNAPDPFAAYAAVVTDLQPYAGAPECVLALLTNRGVAPLGFPGLLYNILIACGGREALKAVTYQPDFAPLYCNYALIGNFAGKHSTDAHSFSTWWNPTWKTDGGNIPRWFWATPVEVDALLMPYTSQGQVIWTVRGL